MRPYGGRTPGWVPNTEPGRPGLTRGEARGKAGTLAADWIGRVKISGKGVDGRRNGGQNGRYAKTTEIIPNPLHGPESCFRKGQAASLSQWPLQLRAIFILGGAP